MYIEVFCGVLIFALWIHGNDRLADCVSAATNYTMYSPLNLTLTKNVVPSAEEGLFLTIIILLRH